MSELKHCKCGAMPEIIETYDTLQIVCKNCGTSTETVVGDYYDEAFMMVAYGQQMIQDWNRRLAMSKEYIDREVLMEDIGENVIFTVRGGAELPTAEMRGANKVIDRIKNQPIVSVPEVKHGEWVLVKPRRRGRNATYKCTCCGKLRSSYYDVQNWEYCPCGAKMEKE